MCCDSAAVDPYECLRLPSSMSPAELTPYNIYGGHRAVAYYDASTGTCERSDERGRGAAAAACAGNADAAPLATEWAAKVCAARAAYEAVLAASAGNETIAAVAAADAVGAGTSPEEAGLEAEVARLEAAGAVSLPDPLPAGSTTSDDRSDPNVNAGPGNARRVARNATLAVRGLRDGGDASYSFRPHPQSSWKCDRRC